MDKFSYKVKDKTGKIITGQIEARGKSEVAALLREQGLFVIEIASAKKKSPLLPTFNFSKISQNEVISFTRQFASMITTGLTVSESLSLLMLQTKNQAFAMVLESILKDIQAGNTISSSLTKHPKAFSQVYVALVKAAEAAGILDKILLRLADNLEKDRAFRSKIRGALVYPAVVVTGIMIVMTIMMIFVVPQLNVLYQSLGIQLPLPTRIVVGISTILGKFWPLIIAFIGLSVFAINRWKKTEVGVRYIDSVMLKLPVFGDLQEKLILTEITRTLGLLIGSGTPILETINITSQTTGNVWYRDSLVEVSRKVEKGFALAVALSEDPHYPLILTQMVRVGETTGKLDDSFLRVSQYFETEATQTVATLTTLLEPMIMVVLGVGVAFLIVSIITPIYNLTSSIQ